VVSYAAPSVTSVSPLTGPSAGGTLLLLGGTNFGMQGTVTIGMSACAFISHVDSQVRTCVSERMCISVWVCVYNHNSTLCVCVRVCRLCVELPRRWWMPCRSQYPWMCRVRWRLKYLILCTTLFHLITDPHRV